MTAVVSRVADLDRAFQTIREKAGHVEVLFVNAGMAKFAPLADSSEGLFDEITGVSFKGAYFTVQRALPLLSEGASAVFTSTTAVHCEGNLLNCATPEQPVGRCIRDAMLNCAPGTVTGY